MEIDLKIIERIYREFEKYGGVSIDTRTIQKGDVFFALSGENFDGNLFVNEALKRGSSLAVTNSQNYLSASNVVVVDDTLDVLQQLAHYHRKQLLGKVIGLTGSNGKTTTKELLHLVLSTNYKTFSTIGNYNNHIGVPLTILSAPKNLDFLIVEMGANAQGEIALLSRIADPDYGLITNIGKAHLEGFGGVEGIIRGKTELYQHLKHNEGKIFLNSKNQILVENLPLGSSIIEYLDYDLHKSSDEIIMNIENSRIHSHLYGKHNAENLITAITVGKYFGISIDEMAIAIADYQSDNNRSSVKKINGNTVFFDAYNANPTSMMASIESFIEATDGSRIIIVGDMLELGKAAIKEHKKIIEYASKLQTDKIYFVGSIFHEILGQEAYLSAKELNEKENIHQLRNKNILIKGSRKIQLEKLFEIN